MASVKRGHGRPRGSKKKKTLAREEAAAAAQGREAHPCAIRGGTPYAVAPEVMLRGRHILEEGEGSRPPPVPSSVARVPEMALAKPLLGFNDLPAFEFLVHISLEGQTRLTLPRQFWLIVDKYVQGSATLREANPQQRSWVVTVERDEEGCAVLTGAWQEFVLYYQIHPDSSLMFRYRKGTSDFVVKIFTMGCRIVHPPTPAE